jgi:hypothetical protein
MDNHEEALEAMFPGQVKQLRQLGEFEKVVTTNMKRFEDFEAGVQKSFRGRIQDLAPERVAEQALSSSFSVQDVRKIVSLAQSAGVKDQYRRAIGDQIRRKFMSETSGLNLNSLDKLISQNHEKLQAVFGDGYVSDMRILLDGLALARKGASGISVTRTPKLGEAIAEGVLRVTAARPLTPGGVALTRFLRFRQLAAERAVARAVMEPDALRMIVAQFESDLNSRKVAEVLAVLGASSLAIEANEE